jgi:hypothetical protein
MNFSAQIPSLLSGESWADHHYANRMALSHPSYSIDCSSYNGYSGPEMITTGIAYGETFGNDIYVEQ